MKSLHLSVPHVIATVGMPGAGKTQFSEKFAEMFGAPLLSTDMIEKAVDNPKTAHDVATDLLKQFMKTKQTLVYDGATEKRVNRAELTRIARAAGYKVLFVWVQTDLATAGSRWTKAHKDSETEFEHLMRQFSSPHDSEPYIVVSGRHTYATQAKTVLRKLTESRAAAVTPSQTIARGAISNRIHIQ